MSNLRFAVFRMHPEMKIEKNFMDSSFMMNSVIEFENLNCQILIYVGKIESKCIIFHPKPHCTCLWTLQHSPRLTRIGNTGVLKGQNKS